MIQMLLAQGVSLSEERAESVVRVIGAQLETERAATRSLAFEQEPSGFLRTLDEGSK
ncbi:MAG: hypothetical protein HYX46_08700 [Betaproteobacteria bacterium]|nr:hypothetical protein [Betaproteobacteria bacterium]